MSGEWQDRARCTEMDGELFFAEGQGTRPDDAKSVCARCEVRAECLAYALEHPELEGVWGGLTERERRWQRQDLTTRQERIKQIASLRFAADGEWVPTAGVVTTAQVAEMLGVSERTVERYKRELRAAS